MSGPEVDFIPQDRKTRRIIPQNNFALWDKNHLNFVVLCILQGGVKVNDACRFREKKKTRFERKVAFRRRQVEAWALCKFSDDVEWNVFFLLLDGLWRLESQNWSPNIKNWANTLV